MLSKCVTQDLIKVAEFIVKNKRFDVNYEDYGKSLLHSAKSFAMMKLLVDAGIETGMNKKFKEKLAEGTNKYLYHEPLIVSMLKERRSYEMFEYVVNKGNAPILEPRYYQSAVRSTEEDIAAEIREQLSIFSDDRVIDLLEDKCSLLKPAKIPSKNTSLVPLVSLADLKEVHEKQKIDALATIGFQRVYVAGPTGNKLLQAIVHEFNRRVVEYQQQQQQQTKANDQTNTSKIYQLQLVPFPQNVSTKVEGGINQGLFLGSSKSQLITYAV